MIDLESILCVSSDLTGRDKIYRLMAVKKLGSPISIPVWRMRGNPSLTPAETKLPRLHKILPFHQLSRDHVSALIKQKALSRAAISALTAYILKGHLDV